MMEIKKLDWDTDFFKFQIAEISTNISSKITGIDDAIRFIQVKSPESVTVDIEGFSLGYEETKVLFSKDLNSSVFESAHEVLDFDIFPVENEHFYQLAYESGKHSRYRLDEGFGQEKFEELYRLWVDNSVNKSFADKIFYIKNSTGTPVAFVTLRINQNVANIGLIASLPEYQGRGLGGALISKCEESCSNSGVRMLQVPTQLQNVSACKFYEKQGFSVAEKTHIRHFWKDENFEKTEQF